ncbi:hypothetical protein E4U42_007863 [Claviceps africana]|uniref:dolichol kinase n=1 Tax=Claviceps africana TaxID=83212 RepID=A0A8K0J2F6_9HYPO|nr:hypothetical protein E4U42_007863 [Claviceps africana]
MSENSRLASSMPPGPDQQDALRNLDRTPKPYRHQSSELPHSSERFPNNNTTTTTTTAAGAARHIAHPPPPGLALLSREPTPASESGSEADDEHFLRGLPAPKTKLHKGLRDSNEPVSSTSTPIPSPAAVDHGRVHIMAPQCASKEQSPIDRAFVVLRRNRNLARRATETGIMASLGYMAVTSIHVAPILHTTWSRDLQYLSLLYVSLLALYPLRVLAWSYRYRKPSRRLPLRIPSHFDPAPLLYPPAITIFVSLLVAGSNPAVVLPNIILSISSLPQALVPKVDVTASYNVLHWAVACLPLSWGSWKLDSSSGSNPTDSFLSPEALVLLYPVHQTLCIVLHHLTTTSLLTTELQLLSIALINVLILSASPQAKILKGLLWGGGLAVLVFCGPVIRWGIALARVPKWRFRKPSKSQKYRFWKDMRKYLSWHRIKNDVMGSPPDDRPYETLSSVDEEDDIPIFRGPLRVQTLGPTTHDNASANKEDRELDGTSQRQHTRLPCAPPRAKRPSKTLSSRRRRTASLSWRPYIRLTQGQATVRRWAYAAYVYTSLLGIILVGVRTYVEWYALDGLEPIGWALGYMLGNLPWFRFQVVRSNLERWICLPARTADAAASPAGHDKHCHLGWVEHLRHSDFGEANTRLVLSAYWMLILVFGLTIVFRLKETYEVDTRRKVFHFMMVGMFLPATYVDPAYAGLALSLVLTIFLILDLLRASQLPPLSKPIASFLAPYVDGRDFRGPVVISHIFLLIGCAIPLWLALSSLPRTGSGCLAGWEVPTRDVSMVSGVICVGLGDAAASLIGRRHGRRKWLWGGGKSLEGSVAFAGAVFVGLAVAGAWLRIGGWPTTDDGSMGIVASARNAGLCASVASLTEAVLTGGNDNVIVPVVLWTCVKSLGI